MKSITQDLVFRQRVVEYAKTHGVTEAQRRYNKSRPTICRWIRRYDGTKASLADYSRRPKHHPNQHTEEEIALISSP